MEAAGKLNEPTDERGLDTIGIVDDMQNFVPSTELRNVDKDVTSTWRKATAGGQNTHHILCTQFQQLLFDLSHICQQIIPFQAILDHDRNQVGRDNAFETGLLVDTWPDDVSCLWENDSLSLCFSSFGCDVTLLDLRDAAANRVMVSAIPVASGNTVTVPSSFIPAKSNACDAKRQVSLAINDDPAALGCSAVTSPARPIP